MVLPPACLCISVGSGVLVSAAMSDVIVFDAAMLDADDCYWWRCMCSKECLLLVLLLLMLLYA